MYSKYKSVFQYTNPDSYGFTVLTILGLVPTIDGTHFSNYYFRGLVPWFVRTTVGNSIRLLSTQALTCLY